MNRRAAKSIAWRMDFALREWHQNNGAPLIAELNWEDYDRMIAAMAVVKLPARDSFIYRHSRELQDAKMGVGKSYPVRLSYSALNGDGETVVAVGGLTNVAERFDFLALQSAPRLRFISLDLAGRGQSGWLAELSDYHLDTYVAQIKQLFKHLKLRRATLLGSSLGGSAMIRFAARYPNKVRRLILNDSGPYIPKARRQRRARAVARHYVFHAPADMFRRTGAAEKHAGPALDAVLLHTAHHKTKWSRREGGRVYQHDLRALLAYRLEAKRSLNLWDDWRKVRCPVLVLHGQLSDALSMRTINAMRAHRDLSVLHIPNTGHTSTLSDSNLINEILAWVNDDRAYAHDRVCQMGDYPPRMFYA